MAPKLWVVYYCNRYGYEVRPVFAEKEPNGEEIIGDDYEPERGDEYIDVLGLFALPPELALGQRALANLAELLGTLNDLEDESPGSKEDYRVAGARGILEEYRAARKQAGQERGTSIFRGRGGEW